MVNLGPTHITYNGVCAEEIQNASPPGSIANKLSKVPGDAFPCTVQPGSAQPELAWQRAREAPARSALSRARGPVVAPGVIRKAKLNVPPSAPIPRALRAAVPSRRLLAASDIEDHRERHFARKLAEDINDSIEGRLCLTKHAHLLYVLHRLLGDDVRYLEIGSLHGGSLCLVMQSPGGGRFAGIDIFSYYGDPLDPGTHLPVSRDRATRNVASLNRHGWQFRFFEGSSAELEQRDKALAFLERVDLLFVDGDHSRAGVERDFELYSPLVSPGGIVAFDNYGQVAPPAWPEVKPAVDGLDLREWRQLGTFGDDTHGYLYIVQREGSPAPSGHAADTRAPQGEW